MAAIYRVYNPTSGEHLFTPDANEKNTLVSLGWTDEGIAWYSPSIGAPLYRMYTDAKGGLHLITPSWGESNALYESGWNREGGVFYSGGSVPVFRLYNRDTGQHTYTARKNEFDNLVSIGWKDEGVTFYAESS